MPSVKRSNVKSAEVKTGFESYDGPEPGKRGMYRSKLRILQFGTFASGAQGFKVLVELEAGKGDPKGHAQFDGYPIWSNLVFGDKEAMLTREGNFYAALGLKDGPAIVFDGKVGEPKVFVDVKTLGGKTLSQLQKIFFNTDIKMGTYNDELRPEVDGIYKLNDQTPAGKKTPVASAADEEPEEDESDLMESEEEEDESEEAATIEERIAELEDATLKDLKALAAEYELEVKPVTKKKLIDAITEYEFSEDEEEDEEEEEDEPEEEEVEEEEEESDERAEREAELGELDRTGLKRILGKANPDFKVYRSTEDSELVEAILNAEFGDDEETPF